MHRRRFQFYLVAVVTLAVFSRTAISQQPPSSPTLIIGTTTVKLGMPKDAVISVLSAQYVVKPQSPNCNDDNPICREYMIYENDKSPVGYIEFNRAGNLLKATVERLPGWQEHTEGEVGKALVTAISNFVAEGLACSIGASSSNSYDTKDPNRVIPEMIFRQAVVECGSKRLLILSTKQKDHPDTMQLQEQIGCPNEILGGCER